MALTARGWTPFFSMACALGALAVVMAVFACAARATGLPPGPPPEYESPPLSPWGDRSPPERGTPGTPGDAGPASAGR